MSRGRGAAFVVAAAFALAACMGGPPPEPEPEPSPPPPPPSEPQPTWHFESLDGPGTPVGDGRTQASVGQEKTATEYAGQLHVFYLGKGDVNHSDWLRHAWF